MTTPRGVEHSLCLSPKHRVPGNSLPDFAVGAIDLGRELYRCAVAGHPRVVVLVVPTRDFFSVFMALGAAQAALACQTRAAPKPVPGDAVVALFETGMLHVAIFEGEAEDARTPGRMRTHLRLKGNQGISAFSDTLTLLRHPSGPDAKVALSTLGSMKETPQDINAILKAYGLEAVQELYTDTPASTILGTKAWLELDMENLKFLLGEGSAIEVSAGQLLLANQSWLLPPLVEVLPYTSRFIREVASPLTILDGASVPLRHGLNLGTGSQAIVLDSTTPEATLELAVGASANSLAFSAPDPDWQPLYNTGLSFTERASYLRRMPQ